MTHQTNRRRRRHSAVCLRHPSSKPTTGFCATCLRERLSTIESLSSSSVAAPSDHLPELRRIQSYSLRDASTTVLDQPRRRSCDIRSNHGLGIVPDSKEEDEQEEEEDGEKKTMKELIDLESRTYQQTKKIASSVFTRTFHKLSLNKHHKNLNIPLAGDDGEHCLGRRSCDVDLRLSRIEFDKPRASLDGCLIGRTYPKLIPLSSLAEDSKTSPEKTKIGGRDEAEEEEEEKKPGGTAQTRDYYLDSRRRRSFDRSSRHGEEEAVSKAKASPEGVGLFHGAKLLVTEKELRDSNWYSIKPDKSLGLGSKSVDCVVASDVVKKKPKGWNLWGLIRRRKTDTTTKKEVITEQSLKLGGNAMEGSLAESLLKLRKVAKGDDVSEKLMRSYSVSARKSCDGGVFRGGSIVNGGFEGGRSSCDGLFHGSITSFERSLREDGLVHSNERKHNHLLGRDTKLDTYSPDNLGNGMVRFYLTPLKNHTTNNSGKTRLMN